MSGFEWVVLVCIGLLTQAVAWLWQRKNNNADSVDVAWSFSMVLMALFAMVVIKPPISNGMVVLFFPVLWNIRLSWYLFKRIDSNHENSRYRYLRAHWSRHTQMKFAAFFAGQALLSAFFCLPAVWVLESEALGPWHTFFVILWGFACLVGVSVADRQLYRFKKHPANKMLVCDRGLWRYSRHPNYFFEWLHWWVYPLALLGTDDFLGALLVVIMMLIFLTKLTGIPFSEQQALRHRGNVYKEYQNRTSAFFLWRRQ